MVTESEAAATYAALRAAAAAAEATLASARAKAAAAEAVAAAAVAAAEATLASARAEAAAVVAAARATVEARVVDAQATTAAMCTHACHAFFDSPHFNLLDARGSLHLVTDAVHEDDALCLALTCRALRVHAVGALQAAAGRRRARGCAGAHAGRGSGGYGGAVCVGAGPGSAVAGVAARSDLRDGRAARRAGLAAVGAGKRLRMGYGHV